MRLRTLVIGLLIAVLFCLSGAFSLPADAETFGSAGIASLETQAKIASVQVPFVPNEGQINDEQVKFYAKTFAGTVYVTGDGIIYNLPGRKGGGWVLKEEFAGARALVPAAASPPGAQVNYYLGSLEKHLSSYQEITLGEVYDKVNVNLRAYGNNVEKIFTVATGGDPGKIALQVRGADRLSVNEQGELELATGLGTVKLTRPEAYQVIDGRRVDVAVAYVVKGDTYGFAVGDYDRTCPLVIDPLLASTYLGGSKGDYLRDIAIDAAGNVFVAGYTNSDTFFTVTGGYRTTLNGTANDAFVAKLSGSLKQLLAATYLGGSAAEQGNAIALDNSGHVYVAGYSASNDFYTTVTPHGSGSDNDFFVVKLDDTHLNLIASTCYGGANKPDNAYAIALDPDGNVFVWGSTQSTDLSVTGYQKSITSGSNHGLLLKYSADLSQILASTYLGGSTYGETLYNNTAAVDQSGDVYVGGTTNSNSFPTTDNAFIKSKTKDQTSYTSGFVSKLSNDLAELKASTYLGGNTGSTTLKALALDSDGNVCVTGETKEDDFPVTTGAAHTGGSANNNNYVAKLKPDLTGLVASTLVGRSGSQTAYDIACDASGYVYVTGNTSSTTYPTTDGAYQPALNGTSSDAFVTKLNPDLSEVNGKPLASTYLGGTGGDYGYAMALNAAGNVYIAGASNSGDFPPNPPNGCQGTIGGNYDGMIARLTGDLALNPAPDTTAPIWPAGSLTVSEATYHELTLNWSGAMDNLDVTGYKIYQSDDTGGSTSYDVSDGAAASYHVTGLTDGVTYTFKIEATDAAGNWSSDGSVTEADTVDIIPPYWVPYNNTGLTCSIVSSTSVLIKWNAASDNVGVTGYRLALEAGGTVVKTVYVDGNTFSYLFTGLDNQTNYHPVVDACDAAGNWTHNTPTNSFVIGTGGLYPTGAYLTTISGNPAASIPGAPVEGSSNVPLKPMLELTFTNNVIADTGKDGVTATWSNNKNCFTLQTAAGADVPVHVLRISDTISSGVEKNNIFITPVNELVPDTQYKLVINKDLTAKNGTSMVLDQEVHFTTGSFTVGAPAWPDGASLTAPVVADTFVKLSWPAASSSAGIAGYIVFQNGDIVAATDGPATSLTVTGLAKSTAYTFKVWAFDAAGNWTITGPELTLTTAATAPASIPGWSAG